jgi:hypothetical protein
MNIEELDSFNLADAVKFHNQLNPRLWDQREHLKPDVHAKLMEIARDFQEFLGVPDLEIKDITVSGSNAAYNYTPHSDVDLHLVVDMPDARNSEVFRELFDAKKFQYNTEHDIRIGGYDVELYVQDAEQEHHSQGIYSLLQNQWISVPKRRKPDVDDISVRSKYEDVGHRIESAIRNGDTAQIEDVWNKLKTMRKQGLEREGEFAPENIVFKMLRNNGTIGKLKQARQAVRDRELSLAEVNRPKQRVQYGFVSESPDGVNPTTKMFLEEDDAERFVTEFIFTTADELGIERVPQVHLHTDDDWSREHNSFGMYEPETHELHVSMVNRHPMDIMRTIAHELAHCRQHEITPLGSKDGTTGSDVENAAHAVAGIIMRNFAAAHPEYFEKSAVSESSGYIPTAAQAKDPRYKMALTVDIKPGQTGKEANKLALDTDAQGRPALLMKTANLREGRMPQPSQGPGKYRDLNEPLGPETPPTMPKGTVKVNVSDVYDWYKLGQHISNLDGLGKHDFGAGPPSAIMSFGSEEEEHKYIKNLEKTGLELVDIDPVDPDQPKDMPKLKTDPTYNVDEEDLVESLRQEFALLEDEYLGEIKMTSTNLRQLAAQTGAQAGMEFEMIVPDVGVDEQEPDWEPDYDQDRRSRSFSDIRDFFHDGDYNSRRDADNLMEEIQNEYEEWQQEQTAEAWARDGLLFMQDYISLNDLFDRDEAMPQARDEIMDANPDLPQESEDFSQLLSARLDEMEREFAASEFEDQGRIYNDAFEAFAEEQRDEYDERSFLDDKYQTMSDIQSNFDISWPYYIDANEGNDGDMDVDQVADEFSSYMGKPVNASRNYHGGRREAGTYVVEPDGSLEGDNPGDEGLEFVSPPMPIDEMISDLNKVKAWADKTGCYTNESTGLHINISVPNYSLEKLDYVKLALLMGDEYVLELFGRSGNHYARSAIGKIKTMLKRNPDIAPQVMDKMREHMEDIATKAIHSGTTDKYTSINTKTGYIEFRSPGGDWLDSNFGKIEDTLLRFTVALSAAIDPEAYRQEYLKKLYKLLEGSQEKGGPDVLQLFANYSAGELDKAALIRQVREKQLARNVEKGKATGKMWWSVGRPGYFASVEVVATSKEEAIAKGKQEYPDWANAQDVTAKPLRPYQDPKPSLSYSVYDARAGYNRSSITASSQEDAVQKFRQFVSGENNPHDFSLVDRAGTVVARGGDQQQPGSQPAADQTGNWGIWMNDMDRFARAPGQIDNNVLRRFPSREAAEQFITQGRAQNSRMRTDIEVREIEPQQTEQPIWYVSPQGNPGQEIQVRASSELNAIRAAGEARPDIFGNTAGRSHLFRASTEPARSSNAFVRRGEAPELYGVRTRQGNNSDAAQGGLIDVPIEIPDTAPRTLTTPGQPQQQFTGEWQVLDPQDREIYRFSGIGNNQSDANRVAMDWMRQNPGRMQAGVTVVPVMG